VNPEQLSATIVDVLAALVADGAVTLPDGVPTEVTVERPRQKGHGDYATNVAMQLAKRAGTNPRAFAELVAERLRASDGVAEVEVAGPGFLNVTVEAGAQGQVAADIARVLQAAGATVAREFYINDRGNQMNLFGASIEAAALGDPIPEDGYQGAYIHDLAAEVLRENPGITDLPPGERLVAFREAGYAIQLTHQQAQLDKFNTHFDVWFSERDLHADESHGSVADTLRGLKDNGHLFEADGALWMRTTDFGDDKDRVLIRSNGELTYFASDTAYYLNKRSRGFDHCIYLLGADHHGYVGRLRAMAACVGDDPDLTLDVMIGQMVKIMQGGEELRLSKRAGTIVTLDELVDEIGVDALRYSLARYPADSPLTLDVSEITRASSDNPVYYVQYAHARTCRMIGNATDLGMRLPDDFDPALLVHERDGELLRALADFPRVVASAADLREPHRVARYLEDTASVFNKWYDTKECRMLPIGDEPVTPSNEARLVLVHATQAVIANGLGLLGVSAPERM